MLRERASCLECLNATSPTLVFCTTHATLRPQACHLGSSSAEAVAAAAAGRPLAQRSILGGLLPGGHSTPLLRTTVGAR